MSDLHLGVKYQLPKSTKPLNFTIKSGQIKSSTTKIMLNLTSLQRLTFQDGMGFLHSINLRHAQLSKLKLTIPLPPTLTITTASLDQSSRSWCGLYSSQNPPLTSNVHLKIPFRQPP